MNKEIITGVGVTAALGAKLAYDVCGPTAKYLGGEFCSYTEKGMENLKRVFLHAHKKLSPTRQQTGQVPPRILKTALSESYFCEDELTAEYLGGILASSKGSASRDDRGLTYLAVLSSMSTYQIRVHYLIYSAIILSDELPSKKHSDHWFHEEQVTVLITEEDIIRSMEYSETEDHDAIIYHCFLGLEAKGLCLGGTKLVTEIPTESCDVPFRYVYPTRFGVDLFMWGLGLGVSDTVSFLDKDFQKQFTSLFDLRPSRIIFGRYEF